MSDTAQLLKELRFRASQAAVNERNITAALHREAADEIEALAAQVSEDRQTRWHLRHRLDAADSELVRLREALRRYVNAPVPFCNRSAVNLYVENYVRKIARDALVPEEDE